MNGTHLSSVRWPALFALIALLSAGTASAQSDARDERQRSPASDVTPSRAIDGTHNCAGYYPDSARRANESGDVLVGYDVAADGAISNVTVVKSSGFADLDGAARACVSQHWRNAPAMKAGVAVASPAHRAIIRFTLRRPDLNDSLRAIGGGGALFLGLAGIALIAFASLLAWLFGRGRRT